MADMRSFNERGSTNQDTHCCIAVDVFSRKTYAEPMRGASAEEAVKAIKQFAPYPKAVDTFEGPGYRRSVRPVPG